MTGQGNVCIYCKNGVHLQGNKREEREIRLEGRKGRTRQAKGGSRKECGKVGRIRTEYTILQGGERKGERIRKTHKRTTV